MDFPVAFEFFVEADLVGYGDGAEHAVIVIDLEAGLYSLLIIFLLYSITPYSVLMIIIIFFLSSFGLIKINLFLREFRK